MSTVRKPAFIMLYNKKNITADITPYIISLMYHDAEADKSDEIQIDITNSTGVWLDEWYPEPGDTIDISIGYDNTLFNCGSFEIDHNRVRFGPDTISIKGIAAGVKNATRTKRSDQHENKTLKQIAEKVAARNSYKLIGDIQDTGQISRVTQDLETDLGFLKRISAVYGHIFSVRGGVITFTNVYAMEALPAAASISRSQFLHGSELEDKTYDTYKKVHVAGFNPMHKKVYETTFSFPEIDNGHGFKYNGIVNEDTKVVRARVDSVNEAQLKAIAALHSSNSKQQMGRIKVPGNPLLVSGNNVEFTECGKLSGIYHIVTSAHQIAPGSAYETTIEVKRVGYIDIVKTKRKKPKKVKPVHVQVVQ